MESKKITHAFAYGGIELLKKTIELNFETKIDNFAIINFSGFKDLIDAIGGLEIDVKSGELKELNRCILLETQDDVQLSSNDAHYLKKPGLQLLNGQQVLAYSRMRHVGNGCYDRSQRQRHVVNLIMSKLKDTSLVKYPSVANKLLPCVKTDLQFTQALDVAYTAYSIGNFDVQQLQIPANKLSYGRMYKDKGWVLLIDKAQNIDVMQKFIFDDIAYDDSKYTTFNYRQSEYYYYEPPVVEEDKNTDDEEKELDDENEQIDSEDNQDINEEDINDQQDNDENGSSEDENNNEDNEDIDQDNSTDEDDTKNDDSILDEENPNNDDNTSEEEEQNSNEDNLDLDEQIENSDNENADEDGIKDNTDSNTNSSTEIKNGIIDFGNEDLYKNEEPNNEIKEPDKEINNDEIKNGNKDDVNQENENKVTSEELQEKNTEDKIDEKLEVQIDKNNSDIDNTM
jgi:polyisoprenyl-teichoic acid--peptidoglycan teichoic acid transferase